MTFHPRNISCADLALPIRAIAQPLSLAPTDMPRIGKLDKRLNSYNIEMAEVIGGNVRGAAPTGIACRRSVPVAPATSARSANAFAGVKNLSGIGVTIRFQISACAGGISGGGCGCAPMFVLP